MPDGRSSLRRMRQARTVCISDESYIIVVCQESSVFKGRQVCYEYFRENIYKRIGIYMKKSTLMPFCLLLAIVWAAMCPLSFAEKGAENGSERSLAAGAETGTPGETPAYGGRILMGSIGEPSNLIPYMASDSASSEITELLYVAPLKYDKDLNVVPWAAASYEVLEDVKLLRFVLRDDIRWEDGVPLTADDVEFTYKIGRAHV